MTREGERCRQCLRDVVAWTLFMLFIFLVIRANLLILIQNLLVIPKPFASQVTTSFPVLIVSNYLFVQASRLGGQTAAVFANRNIKAWKLSRYPARNNGTYLGNNLTLV